MIDAERYMFDEEQKCWTESETKAVNELNIPHLIQIREMAKNAEGYWVPKGEDKRPQQAQERSHENPGLEKQDNNLGAPACP